MGPIYFSNIRDVQIKIVIENVAVLWGNLFDFMKEILEVFENLKTFLFHFYDELHLDLRQLCLSLKKMFRSLNIQRNFENYRIKQNYNYLQLIKKEQ